MPNYVPSRYADVGSGAAELTRPTPPPQGPDVEEFVPTGSLLDRDHFIHDDTWTTDPDRPELVTKLSVIDNPWLVRRDIESLSPLLADSPDSAFSIFTQDSSRGETGAGTQIRFEVPSLVMDWTDSMNIGFNPGYLAAKMRSDGGNSESELYFEEYAFFDGGIFNHDLYLEHATQPEGGGNADEHSFFFKNKTKPDRVTIVLDVDSSSSWHESFLLIDPLDSMMMMEFAGGHPPIPHTSLVLVDEHTIFINFDIEYGSGSDSFNQPDNGYGTKAISSISRIPINQGWRDIYGDSDETYYMGMTFNYGGEGDSDIGISQTSFAVADVIFKYTQEDPLLAIPFPEVMGSVPVEEPSNPGGTVDTQRYGNQVFADKLGGTNVSPDPGPNDAPPPSSPGVCTYTLSGFDLSKPEEERIGYHVDRRFLGRLSTAPFDWPAGGDTSGSGLGEYSDTGMFTHEKFIYISDSSRLLWPSTYSEFLNQNNGDLLEFGGEGDPEVYISVIPQIPFTYSRWTNTGIPVQTDAYSRRWRSAMVEDILYYSRDVWFNGEIRSQRMTQSRSPSSILELLKGPSPVADILFGGMWIGEYAN